MTYEEALTYIHSVSWKGSQPGLSRIAELLRRMGNPERGLRFVHVVGTNGKGSTCAMLASILRAAGYRTGLYTSPYLVDFRERMQIDGEMIPKRELAAATEAVRPHIESMEDSPTEFERITAIALWWFAKKRCQIVVLEAGMGGAYDATNVIPAPELAVFTNVGLDHTEYLGDTVEKIAATKAGILKPGCAAVLYPNERESVNEVIRSACRERNVPLYPANFDEICAIRQDLSGQSFRCPPYSELFLPLLGAHQLRNAAVALTAVRALRERGWTLPEKAVRQGLAAVSWPGRLELVRREPPLLLDGGHNAQCIGALCRALDDCLPGTPLCVVTGVLADKDYADMYERLAPYAACFLTLTPDNPRALPAAALAEHLARFGKPVTACAGVRRALRLADGTGLATLCCGSLYLIGEIKKELVPRGKL